jgi:hypothetical protein
MSYLTVNPLRLSYKNHLVNARGSVVVKALGYKPEGRVFKSR